MRFIKVVIQLVMLLLVFTNGFIYCQSDFWVQTKGPYRATVRSLARTTNGYLLAGTDAGLYRSTNKGLTWEKFPLPYSYFNTEPRINSVYVHSSGIIMAGAIYGGLYLSTDNGNSWKAPGLSQQTDVRSVIVVGAGNLYAGTYRQGLLKSTNQGQTWDEVGIPTYSIFSLLVTPQNYIFAASDSGIFRSFDNGLTWSLSKIPTLWVRCLAVNQQGLLYAGTWSKGVFRSSDNGNTWIATNSGFPPLNTIYIESLCTTPSGYVYAGTGTDGLYRSTNDGNSWQKVGFANRTILSILPTSSDEMYVGDFQGVAASVGETGQWVERNVGLLNTYPLRIVVDSQGKIFASLPGGALFRSSSNGENWELINDQIGGLFVFDLQGNIFVGYGGTILRSTDSGNTWATLKIDLAQSGVSTFNVDFQGYLYAVGSNSVFKSTDSGKTWKKIKTGPSVDYISEIYVNSKGDVFLVSDYRGVYLSENNSNSWTNIAQGFQDKYFRSVLIDPLDRIFVTSSQGVFRSRDNGKTWELANAGLEYHPAWCLAINSRLHLFAGTTDGVFRSTDAGKSWTPLGMEQQSMLVLSIAVSPSGYVLAGTNGQGIFRSMESTTGIPTLFHLSQNYPNPFNSTTIIEFDIPQTSEVRISIFNVLGQQIESLLQSQLPAGRHFVRWRPSTVGTGVYFYRLQVEGFSETKKLIFLK